MKRYYIINEDFFDNFNDEDNEELTKEEIKPSYENILTICHYIPSNKKLLGRKSIDIIPLVRIIKQFFSIIQTLRFVREYNVKIWFLGIDLLKSDIDVVEKNIIVRMHIKGADFLKAKKTDKELAKVLKNLFGIDLRP